MCSLFCLGLHEDCNAGVFFNPSQQWLPPSPEQKGFLQSTAFLLGAVWAKCEPADVQHFQPIEKSPGDHENKAQRFLGVCGCCVFLGFFVCFGFFLEDSLFYWQISLMCFPLQKLSGQTINPMLRMFGQSISGGVDMDGNGYPGTSATLAVRALGKHSSRLRKQQSWSFPGCWFLPLQEADEAENFLPFPLCYSKLLIRIWADCWIQVFGQLWWRIEILKQRISVSVQGCKFLGSCSVMLTILGKKKPTPNKLDNNTIVIIKIKQWSRSEVTSQA